MSSHLRWHSVQQSRIKYGRRRIAWAKHVDLKAMLRQVSRKTESTLHGNATGRREPVRDDENRV